MTFIFISCTEKEKGEEKKSPKAALLEWLDTNYEEMLQRSPIQRTMQGRKDHYNKVDDMSEEAQDELLLWQEASVYKLKENFDYEALSEDDKISNNLWVYQYDEMKEGKEHRNMGYVFHQMGCVHTFFTSFVINF
ncbi:hypothetical protein [Gillisia limnaea]|uniref:Uncharacterized protein n=1 Tax=Gillisia limnaea (strain DSM 15749 / LMG 21470 / R-8282) TaxID=865937 RepID=H2BT02_GILLR|nr:hypothetical protein [Gillisia limnaea]EHQ01532.1 protein of unknown function DUF885 [Gillisia limnaea DSM 15749]